jgi:ABC-type transporter MlaC component
MRALGALLLCLGTAAGAAAQPTAAAHPAAHTVMQQLEAFRHGDYDTAYSFASQTIHELFDRAGFERMVTTGYPEIARSRSAVVQRAEDAPNGHVYLFVTVYGANGNNVDAVYELVQENGDWKINAVVAKRAGGTV